MKRPVRWSDAGRAEFRRQIDFVRESSPRAARLVRDRLLAAIGQLSQMQAGRKARVEGTFELYVPKTSLIIVYDYVEGGSILRLLRFIHTSRDFPTGRFPPLD
jgi:plasmid stabilization system protein ParE